MVGSDREIAKRAASLGYHNVAISKVLGEHDSAPNVRIAYFKYYDMVIKYIYFAKDKNRAINSLVRTLKNKYRNNGGEIELYAYAGALFASKSNSMNKKIVANNEQFYRDYKSQIITAELRKKIESLKKGFR